ncbi:MAG TPA: ribulokinase [Clostridiales bacterium]|nr:ribulokinase [Clostridiales bacterium]
MAKYAIGIDFGTLSARALLVDVSNGRELASAVSEYAHGVIDEALPCGVKLGQDWALQDPRDYLAALNTTVREVIQQSGIDKNDIIGVGVDFTACTLLPVRADSTPLCILEEYARNPHAYVKLWKHHAAQKQANRLNEIARARGESWLDNYGGKISSEWAIPKIMQLLEEAPEIYEAADRFIEAADWIVWILTGVETRNSCCAGYKALWNKNTGYPDCNFFRALDARLEFVVDEKLGRLIQPLASRAGRVTASAAETTGLAPGTAVAVGAIDAHVFVPAAAIDREGEMLVIMGTSNCHMMMSSVEKQVKGICGVVADGIMPGLYGYEAGQGCVGDHFQWFIDNCLPQHYYSQAAEQGVGIHRYLREKAALRKPGESGLVALDWWNGNRSVLVDADLTGLMLGMTLQTKPEDMYRALIEATAYGTRMIIETFREQGVAVDAFCAAGGISKKDPLMMQIYADVIKMPVKIAGSEQGGALGSAIFGAVAAGAAAGGYNDVFEAARAMGSVSSTVYEPNAEASAVYDKLFEEYKILHDYFGRGGNDVMKRLKAIIAGQ